MCGPSYQASPEAGKNADRDRGCDCLGARTNGGLRWSNVTTGRLGNEDRNPDHSALAADNAEKAQCSPGPAFHAETHARKPLLSTLPERHAVGTERSFER